MNEFELMLVYEDMRQRGITNYNTQLYNYIPGLVGCKFGLIRYNYINYFCTFNLLFIQYVHPNYFYLYLQPSYTFIYIDYFL